MKNAREGFLALLEMTSCRRACHLEPFGRAAMWMSSRYTAMLLFFPFFFPAQERLAAMRGTAPGRHTDFKCAPLGTKPRDLCLKDRTVRSFALPVLTAVESFPGAMSPLGSKEPNELFVSPH